jgi:hypothetical protein
MKARKLVKHNENGFSRKKSISLANREKSIRIYFLITHERKRIPKIENILLMENSFRLYLN